MSSYMLGCNNANDHLWYCIVPSSRCLGHDEASTLHSHVGSNGVVLQKKERTAQLHSVERETSATIHNHSLPLAMWHITFPSAYQ